MSRYIYFVQSNAAEGRDDEFNEWYDSTHVPQILALEGFESARRFKRSNALDPADAPTPDFSYAAMYEISGDPVAAVQGLGQAVRNGDVGLSDAMAPGGVASVLWEAMDDTPDRA